MEEEEEEAPRTFSSLNQAVSTIIEVDLKASTFIRNERRGEKK